MPIIERTPRQCFDVFAGHLRALVTATVTERYPLQLIQSDERASIGFREQGPLAIPIDTAYGRLHFYLGQSLEAVAEGDRWRLTTAQDWYRVQPGPSLQEQAAVRWEYDSTTEVNRHARHHAQMRAGLPLGDGELDLNKAHLPTGWVTIEEVIRFLIVDLAVAPPCGDSWPQMLLQSERAFYEDFTSKRHRSGDL